MTHFKERKSAIDGMTCDHCAMAVQRALEALPEVEEVRVRVNAGAAFVNLKAELEDKALKDAVEAEGYQVTGITREGGPTVEA